MLNQKAIKLLQDLIEIESFSKNESGTALFDSDGGKLKICEVYHYNPQAAYRFFDTTSAINYLNNEFSFESFTHHVNENLNSFQRPCFLRLSNEMKTTGTFKHQKEDLKKQGFNPESIDDKLFFYQKSFFGI